MALREAIQRVLADYPTARAELFKGHKLAEFLRHDFPDVLRPLIKELSAADGSDYIVEGSAGQGQWVRCPWVAVFDPIVTDSAERGFYPVYLFREDFTGLYLTFNQVVTDVREQYKARVKEDLEDPSSDFRTRLGSDTKPFTTDAIDLRPSSSTDYPADYEAGNIVAKFYAVASVPGEQALKDDLRAMLAIEGYPEGLPWESKRRR